MLNVSNITYRVAGRTLLENTSFTIPDGHRVGLVGANGTGKSTLFNLISGELALDAGEISVNADAKVGMVKQEIDDENAKLIDIVLVADTERADLMERLETEGDPSLLAEIYEKLANIHAYEAPARASTILSGLGFSDEEQQLPIKDFSGGWRMRVALAAALFREPDLLMLDEPTNHLDFEAMIWLENYLMNYKNTLLIISHDRDILNKTVDHIVHLDSLKLNTYTGNYDQFETRRAEKLMNQQALHEKQMAQKNKMMAFVDRFGAKASKAKQAQSRLKAIGKMDIVDAVIASRVTAFNFPSPEDLPPPIITLNNVDVGYEPSKPILSSLELRIDMEDRIALLGANGNGKSTLIKLLSGRLPQLTGHMERPDKLRVGYFAQHQSEELDMNATPYELLHDVMRSHGEAKTRALLGKFGFNKAKSDTKVDSLSGGEKARLLFCIMSYDAPHIMLLDEPTNHLDIDAREALIQALNNYNGCVIIVSHDPHLVACVADRLWLVADGTCKSYEGDLDEYRELIIQQRRKERSSGNVKKKSGLSKKEQRKLAAERRKQLAPLRQEITKAETVVEKLAQEKESLELKIANSDASDISKMADLQATYGKTKKELAVKEVEWETLQSEYDQKMAG